MRENKGSCFDRRVPCDLPIATVLHFLCPLTFGEPDFNSPYACDILRHRSRYVLGCKDFPEIDDSFAQDVRPFGTREVFGCSRADLTHWVASPMSSRKYWRISRVFLLALGESTFSFLLWPVPRTPILSKSSSSPNSINSSFLSSIQSIYFLFVPRLLPLPPPPSFSNSSLRLTVLLRASVNSMESPSRPQSLRVLFPSRYASPLRFART
jgi:hypothetical protein